MLSKSRFFFKNIFLQILPTVRGSIVSTENFSIYSGEAQPFALDDKGGEILVLPSSPKGDIVGILAQVWSYGIGVVLDGKSLS